MSRRKKTPFREWESTKENGIEKRYVRLASTKIAKMHNLSSSAFKIFMFMCMESAGKQTFEFPRSKYKDFMSSSTFDSAKKELIERGFIEEIEKNQNLRKANVYKFSSGWKEAQIKSS